jgi:hypothetical protein
MEHGHRAISLKMARRLSTVLGASVERFIDINSNDVEVKRNFFKYKNTIGTGKGNIAGDIETARNHRMEKHR